MRMMRQMLKSVTLVALGLALAAGAAYAQTNNTAPCIMPDNGTGTVTLPPTHCGYISPERLHLIIKGLPPGTVIVLQPTHHEFFCRNGVCNFPGGPLGGEVENFDSIATFKLSVSSSGNATNNPLAGWTRTVSVPLAVQTATAPRTPGAQVQTFKTDMQRIQGSITNDPDFDLFEVVGGTANGFPSPGNTTLTRQADGTFKVDSSFDVGYQIRFIGAPGGKLAGYGGATTGSVGMTAVQPCPASGCPCP
jgi:hypothetical protein